jgi:hypothetical protein
MMLRLREPRFLGHADRSIPAVDAQVAPQIADAVDDVAVARERQTFRDMTIAVTCANA